MKIRSNPSRRLLRNWLSCSSYGAGSRWREAGLVQSLCNLRNLASGVGGGYTSPIRQSIGRGGRLMKRWLLGGVGLAFSVSLFAQSGKPCEELKSEIAKKLEANGVTTFSLEIVPKN